MTSCRLADTYTKSGALERLSPGSRQAGCNVARRLRGGGLGEARRGAYRKRGESEVGSALDPGR